MIATIALDATGQWHYVSDECQRDRKGRPVAPRERDAVGHFVAAAEIAEAICAYVAREALRIAQEQMVATARAFAQLLALVAPPPKPSYAKAERIAATAPGRLRGPTKSEVEHVRRGKLWNQPLHDLAVAHRDRYPRGVMKFHVLQENNEWEGERWWFYVLEDGPDVAAAMELSFETSPDIDIYGVVHLSSAVAADRQTLDNGGYMRPHRFFERLRVDQLLDALAADDGALYKGQIDKYADEMSFGLTCGEACEELAEGA